MNFKFGLILLSLAILGNLNSYSQLPNSKLIPGFTLPTGELIACGTIVSIIDTSKIINPCNASGDSCDSIIDWTWYFDGGRLSKLKNPTFNTYPGLSESPYHNVFLKVRTKYGLVDSLQITVFVVEQKVLFKVLKNDTIITVGDSVIFYNSSSALDVSNSNWLRNFGDGKTISDSLFKSNLGHRYSAIGKFEVYFTWTLDFTSLGFKTKCIVTYPDTTLNEKKIIITVKEAGSILDHYPTKLSIFPNPAKDYILIKGFEKGDLIISDLCGKEILKEKLKPNEYIDISELTKGIYFVKCTSGGMNYTGRFIKD